MTQPLVIGTAAAVPLAEALDATFEPLPNLAFGPEWAGAETLEEWRSRTAAGPRADRIVVAAWTADLRPRPLVDRSLDEWVTAFEEPFALWFAALSAACARGDDDGTVVAVVDRPAPVHSAGWGAEAAVADAVEVTVRSLARAEGGRGVRVNAVSTPRRADTPTSAQVALPGTLFTGSLDEVVGTVSLLLSPDAAGVTATSVATGWGRS
jgi:NAD(P)-dependent dehydrogenase (short-subunit alcohol dehydrogenase family)